MKYITLLIAFFIFVSPAQAKLFKNSYISFEIPNTWSCKAFGTDWVCQNQTRKKRLEALITSTAKIAGRFDTLDQYLDYLQRPKRWQSSRGEQIVSKKISTARRTFINKFPWIVSIHRNSEVKSYTTRYAGTVCCKNTSAKLGILVVLSAHEKHYTKYSRDFVKTVNSLKVMDIEKAISKVRASQMEGAGMSGYLEGLFNEGADADLEGAGPGAGQQGIFGLSPTQMGLGLALFVVLLSYLLLKRKRSPAAGSSRSSRRRRR